MVCSCRVVQPQNASAEVQRVYAVISSDKWWASSERRLSVRQQSVVKGRAAA